MSISDEIDAPFILVISLPRVSRVVALLAAALYFSVVALLAVTVGPRRAIGDFFDYPTLLLVPAGLLAAGCLFLRMAFPPRKALQRLEFRPASVSFVPDRMTRRLFAEPTVDAAITPQSKEILLCRSIPGDVSGGLGYRVIIRAEDGTERGVKAGYLTFHSVREGQQISEGITAATGLPVRIIGRRRLQDGTIEETPWTVPTVEAKLQVAAAFIVGIMAFPVGITAGFLVTNPAMIVAIGLATWLCRVLVVNTLHIGGRKWGVNSLLHLVTDFFMFAASYGASVAIVASMFRSH